jgi:hypothetical protein
MKFTETTKFHQEIRGRTPGPWEGLNSVRSSDEHRKSVCPRT